MTAFLTQFLGRLPVGWLQLVHNPLRLAAALAGVSFANILVFMQLGFLNALIETIQLPYDQMNADVLVTASDMNTLADGGPLPRQRMYQALAVNGVNSATPLYVGKIDWKQPDGTIRVLDIFGVDPDAHTFRSPQIEAALPRLMLADHAAIDRKTRNVEKGRFKQIDSGAPFVFEARGRSLTVASTFDIGGGFSDDGYLFVSDQTFLRLFPQRAAGAPNLILISVDPASAQADVAARLRVALPAYDSAVRTVSEATARDQSYQTTQKPVGVVFGFGVVIGVIVGLIIVYQVLSTDVADHLREYATFKAMGYNRSFFLGVVFEEALILAVLGFVPGVLISLALYALVSIATDLPLRMTLLRGFLVLAGTLAMCAVSGAVATRRLDRADPADLF